MFMGFTCLGTLYIYSNEQYVKESNKILESTLIDVLTTGNSSRFNIPMTPSKLSPLDNFISYK